MCLRDITSTSLFGSSAWRGQKVRLCVQGCTLESGVDFDQNFSSTLRHCSARCLCAHAARKKCSVRSIDFVSAYLQGMFLDGEVLYCHMPAGCIEKDGRGVPFVCCIQKPIYGVPQAGRRLQRCLFDWMLDVNKAGLRQLDDSDNTIFVYDDPRGKETFSLSVYMSTTFKSYTPRRSMMMVYQWIQIRILPNFCTLFAKIGKSLT